VQDAPLRAAGGKASARGLANAADGTKATLGIRPEHVAPDGGAHPATVAVIEDAGPHRILLLRFVGGGLHLLVSRDFDVRPGATLRPRIEPARALLWPVP
jgi:multiple sugar transport system ATP-binding protein